ncbi:hypothetical protein [Luteolibacter soli]|uniref:DUF302 domain-containing protein n=1 Tax=Luteolibacter soli TaxID=3135280 RepID=A0ABU9ARV6_9BACT
MSSKFSVAGTACNLFAVHTISGQSHPTSRDDLHLMPCPVVVLKENADGSYELAPKIVVEFGLIDPGGENFLGFADSFEQAVGNFLPRSPL